MPVFDSAVKTVTGNNSMTKDNVFPNLGMLNSKSMPSLTALAGTNGAECAVIHADRWYQVDGQSTETVEKNFTTHIHGKEERDVKLDLNNCVMGNTNDTRVGVHNQTNIAPRNDEFLHTRSEIHHQPEHRDQKTEDNDLSEKVHEFIKEHSEFNWLKTNLITGPEISVNPVFAFEYNVIASAYKNIAAETAMLECELKELKTAIQIVASDVVAVKAKAAVSHLKAIGANLNAGIAANADSPLG